MLFFTAPPRFIGKNDFTENQLPFKWNFLHIICNCVVTKISS